MPTAVRTGGINIDHLSNILNTNVSVTHLVIPLTEELEPLGSLVHEDSVQVACLYSTDLNGLFSPAHDLVRADMCCTQGERENSEHANFKRKKCVCL